MCDENEGLCFICLKPSMEYIDLELGFTTNKFPLPFSYTYKDCLKWCIRGLGVDILESLCSNRMMCVDCGAELQTTFEFLYRIKLHVIDLEVGIGFDLNDTLTNDEIANKIESEDSNATNKEDLIGSDFTAPMVEELKNEISCSSIDSEIIQSEFHILESPIKNSPGSDDVSDPRALVIQHDEISLDMERYENLPGELLQPELKLKPDIPTVYVCTKCKNFFKTHDAMQEHNCQKQVRKTHQCKICNEEISQTESLKDHIKNSHMRMIQCSQCDYKGCELKMKSHELKEHATSEDFTCELCDKTFSTMSSLKNHLKYHERKKRVTGSTCKVCGKHFITPQYLQQHLKLHKQERELYQCEHCEKAYVSKKAREVHMRLHTGETMTCPWCAKHFSRIYELKVHMRFHTKEFPFKCDSCDKQFAIKSHLKTHMWKHQGLKLQCNHCGKLFNTTKALKEHSFTHTQMPFVCSYCFKGYPSKQKYGIHLKTAHFKELNDEEFEKASTKSPGQPVQRKKVTLVQADSFLKEVEVKSKTEHQERMESLKKF